MFVDVCFFVWVEMGSSHVLEAGIALASTGVFVDSSIPTIQILDQHRGHVFFADRTGEKFLLVS